MTVLGSTSFVAGSLHSPKWGNGSGNAGRCVRQNGIGLRRRFKNGEAFAAWARKTRDGCQLTSSPAFWIANGFRANNTTTFVVHGGDEIGQMITGRATALSQAFRFSMDTSVASKTIVWEGHSQGAADAYASAVALRLDGEGKIPAPAGSSVGVNDSCPTPNGDRPENKSRPLRRCGDREPGALRRFAKRLFLRVSRMGGLFALARYLTRRELRILCYHGFTYSDHAAFRPGLFINLKTFERRLNYLTRAGINVLPLAEAIDLLSKGQLNEPTAVITIDDGFTLTLEAARTLMAPRAMPATVYVTTYYAAKQTPIFRLAVAYMYWKTTISEFDLGSLVAGWSGKVKLVDRAAAEDAIWKIVDYGEQQLDHEGRCELVSALGQILGVDYERIAQLRFLTIMNGEELREMESLGMDIELHTHRHRFPVDEAEVVKELNDNRAWLREIVASPLEHFCYPSGEWAPEHAEWLAGQGVKTAVTCDVGLNRPDTPTSAMRRFLDGEHISQIEFEAEVSGYTELLRRLRAWFNSLARRNGS